MRESERERERDRVSDDHLYLNTESQPLEGHTLCPLWPVKRPMSQRATVSPQDRTAGQRGRGSLYRGALRCAEESE